MHPTMVYADKFVRHQKLGRDMMELGLFPNFKEVTESFACYAAAQQHLQKEFSFHDPGVVCVVVGDGTTPRTAATFAFRSAWQCISVDPRMNRQWLRRVQSPSVRTRYPAVQRLTLSPVRIEEAQLPVADRVVVVACHLHARLGQALARVEARRVAVIAIPCCVPQELDVPHDVEYEDWGCWSHRRTVLVWRDVVAKRELQEVACRVQVAEVANA